MINGYQSFVRPEYHKIERIYPGGCYAKPIKLYNVNGWVLYRMAFLPLHQSDNLPFYHVITSLFLHQIKAFLLHLK